jgi:Mg2+ and Co2+ transporter CorA
MQLKESRTNTQLAQASTAIAKASKEDSAVMKTIAVESKKDSTAMKTIAILGMAFLPGTFVAVSMGTFIALTATKCV